MLDCMQDRQQMILTTKLDKAQYDENDLISIKTPLNLPYYSSSSEFERAYGSLNVNGIEYEYVQRRVFNDTLELLCLPNHDKTKLQSVKNDFLQISIDGQTSLPNKKSSGIVKISLPDFSQEWAAFSLTAISTVSQKYFLANFSFKYADHSTLQEQPPEFI